MSDQIKINGKIFEPIRVTLRGWTKLEELRMEMEEAISKKDFVAYFESTVKFIEIASIPSEIKWDEVSWQEFLTAFTLCVEKNLPTLKFPILESTKEKNEKAPWEYSGRSWYFWLNLFAGNYGWTSQYVGYLDIDTAIGLFQEITIADQQEKEWQYGLSELAYPYNETTKKSNFKPLDRPSWMQPITPEPKKIKIRSNLLPVGNVINPMAKEMEKRGI